MQIILYSNNCPKCKILKTKLDEKNIKYTSCSNLEEMLTKGFKSVPMLEVDNIIYTFNEAIKWVTNNE